MNCSKCGGWQFYTAAEVEGRLRVVLKCMACKEITVPEREGTRD